MNKPIKNVAIYNDNPSNSQMFRVDFITARKEEYPFPGALPQVSQSHIIDDILRRDFSINTLAIKINENHFGRLIDLCFGLRDIHIKRIRTLHCKSFMDDPTRIFRAVRYEQRYHFHINQTTLKEIQNNKKYLSNISSHRIKQEFDKIFLELECVKMMERLEELMILKEIHPFLTWEKQHSSLIKSIPNKIPSQKWGIDCYSDEVIRNWIIYSIWFSTHTDHLSSLFERFNLELSLRKIILSLVDLSWHSEVFKAGSVSEMVAILDNTHPVSQYAYYLMSVDEEVKNQLILYHSRYKNEKVSPAIREYIYAHVPSRKMIGKVIEETRKNMLNGVIKNEDQVLHWLNAKFEELE